MGGVENTVQLHAWGYLWFQMEDDTDGSNRRPRERPIRPSGTPVTPKWRGRLHLGALIFAVPAAVVLVVRDPVPSVVTYAVGLVMLYAVSSSYHLLPLAEPARHRMRQADHSMIYIFIATAYTPLCIIGLPGNLGKVILALAWLGAAVGVTMAIAGLERTRLVGGPLYIVLGWLAVLTLPEAIAHLQGVELALLAVMGVLYTAGAVAFSLRWPDPVPEVFGYHEVWHSSVIVASACYYAVVWMLSGPHR